MQIIKPGTRIDFVGKAKIFVTISVVAVLASIALFFTKGLNYGIDFTGGAEIHVKVPTSWEIGQLRSELDKGGLGEARVIQIGEPGSGEFLVKAQGDEASLREISGKVAQVLGTAIQGGEFEILRADMVGPAAGESLRKSGFLAMLYALLCIMIYIAIRFDMRYAPGAVLSLFHDAVIVVGVFIIAGKQFDLQILAAILALIGYSINDTVVVYDRIREVSQQYPQLTVEEVVNKATNDTLGRSILTSLLTLFSAAALWLLGGSVIENFAFALVVGVVVGSYSTIFVASVMVVWMTHYFKRREAKAKGAPSVRRPEPKLQS